MPLALPLLPAAAAAAAPAVASAGSPDLPQALALAFTNAGGYVSIPKLVPIVLILLIWGRLMTWIDKDAEAAHLPRDVFNAAIFGAGILGFALFFFLPNFWIALGALLFLILASIGGYLIARNAKVGLKDLKTEFNAFVESFGKKKVKEAKAGEVQILLKAGPMPVPKAEDPDRKAYDTVMEILTGPLRKNAERIEVRAAEGAASMQYVVDGVAYGGPGIARENAAAAVSYLKAAAGLDVADRRKPQNGVFKTSLDGKKREIEIATAGTTVGESMRLTVEPKKKHVLPLDALGFTEDQLAQVKAAVEDRKGIVLLAAPKGQGLTSLLYAIMRAHDAFVHHLQTVEHAPKEDLEGITQNPVPAQATPAEEIKQVEWVCSQQPDVVMVDDIANPASARELIRFVAEEGPRRVYLGVRAGSAFEALAIWRKLVGDDALAAEQLRMLISGRVMRRLCMACKVGFQPDPETLRRYNMNPERVTQLFSARTVPMVDPKGRPIPCTFCHDLRYKGRFGVFELINVDDAVRQAIATGASVEALKNVFRKQRGRYLQEMALAQVEAGETSVEEVIRVLKGGGEAQARPPQRPSPPGNAVAV